MSDIAIIGYSAIVAAFIATAMVIISSVIAGMSGSRRYRLASEYGTYVVAGFFAIASTAIIHAFIHQDYSLLYVYHYSDATMPWIYQVCAFWGGQAGSLMFWGGILSILMLAVVVTHRRDEPQLLPWVTAVIATVLIFFIGLLLFAENPFASFSVIDAPADGKGLNPQLQTFTMVIHPPSLLTGYVACTVPFAFGVAALISGRLDEAWLKLTRKWTLIAWLFLSIGLMLGMLWAYTELGWGGYWAWDPVENAAFLPWLVMTAFIHSSVIQERRGMLKSWNMSLVLLAWLLTIFGTYLTRSGLIASVHSFAQSEIGTYFEVFLIVMTAGCIGLMRWRWGKLRSEHHIESFLSREFAFLFNNWILLAATAVVFVGTLWPKLSEMFFDKSVSMGPPWFNEWMTPIGILLLGLVGVGTMISWRRATAKNFRRNFLWPLIAAVVATAGLALFYRFWRLETLGADPDPDAVFFAIVTLFGCCFVTSTIVLEFWRGTRSRMRKLGLGPFTALAGLVARNQRRYGGYIVHLGMVLLFLGFAGNAFKVEVNATLVEGQMAPLGDYNVKLHSIHVEHAPDKEMTIAKIELIDASDGSSITTLYPARWKYYSQPDAPTSEIEIRSTPAEDVYFALTGFFVPPPGSKEPGMAAFMMVINPFVFFIWLGGGVLIFGTLLAMWPISSGPTPSPRKKRRSGTSAAVLIAAALGLSAPASDAHADDPQVQLQVYDSATREVFELIKCECPNCGGQSIGRCRPTCGEGRRDRARIVKLMDEGRSKDEILQVFVAERGEDVLMSPPNTGTNILAWAIPVGSAVIAVPMLIFFARRRSRDADTEPAPPTEAASERDVEEDERLAELERELDRLD